MNNKLEMELSKTMSYILRHNPCEFGIVLDEGGYCEIDLLISTIRNKNKFKEIDINDINRVVQNCQKQRYEIKENLIKARYGHSSNKIKYEEKTPLDILYHGTNTGVVELILQTGIKSMNRQYVHMSESTHFATLAGQRKGTLAMLIIDSKKASEDGVKFYYAGNEVWLAEYIPSEYVKH